MAQAGNEAVAPGEVVREGRGAKRVLAQQQTVPCDAVCQVAVLARVDPVQSGAHDGDRGQGALRGRGGFRGALESAFVRGTIDAECESRYHGPAHLGKAAGELAGIVGSLGRGVAAAHHGDAAQVRKGVDLPHGIKHERRIGHFQQQ